MLEPSSYPSKLIGHIRPDPRCALGLRRPFASPHRGMQPPRLGARNAVYTDGEAPHSFGSLSLLSTVLALPLVALADSGLAGAFQAALEGKSLSSALLLSFGAGIATSLTPCVYPMIAITVSVFGARKVQTRCRGRRAVVGLRGGHDGAVHHARRDRGAERRRVRRRARQSGGRGGAGAGVYSDGAVDVRRLRAGAALLLDHQAQRDGRHRLQGRVRAGHGQLGHRRAVCGAGAGAAAALDRHDRQRGLRCGLHDGLLARHGLAVLGGRHLRGGPAQERPLDGVGKERLRPTDAGLGAVLRARLAALATRTSRRAAGTCPAHCCCCCSASRWAPCT